MAYSRSSGRGNSGGGRGKKPNNFLKLLKILRWLCVAAMFWFAYINIGPYEIFVRRLSGGAINQAFLAIISAIPIINGIAAILGRGITWIVGTIVWGVLQIFELLPMVLYSHDDFLVSFVRDADARTPFNLKDDDHWAVKKAKIAYNSAVAMLVGNLEVFKAVAYFIDFLICISVYSPVAGGNVGTLFWVLLTGQWGKIDWGNMVLIAITLFTVEALVYSIIWIGKAIFAIKKATT